MKKLLPILLLTALVLAACGSGGAVAATVDGTDITVGDVENLVDTGGSTIALDQFAQFLGFEIQWQIVEVAARDEFGIDITDDEISAEADRIYETANQGESREEFVASRGVTEQFLLQIAHQGLIDTAVREELSGDIAPPTQEEIDTEMAAAAATVTDVCVSHILVPTEEEAQDALERVTTGGEEFGVVAAELSQDPGSAANNGVLPCAPAGQYVAEFRDASIVAPIGEVYDEVVASEFGFHVMLVTDRVDPAEDALPTEETIIESLEIGAQTEVTNIWFFDQIAAAEVTVGEEYGTWNPSPPQPGVVPPTTGAVPGQ